jgi:Tfp pilus assembly protein PilN
MIEKIMQKDLNLFKVYKSSSSKAGGNNFKSVILIAISFILIVALAYGVIFYMKFNLQGQIQQIKNDLKVPSVVENQNKLSKESNRNQLMTKYNAALKTAKSSFDASRFIDAELFGKITSAIPADVIMSNITINPQSINLNCTCTDKLAPAIFAQALSNKDLFVLVTYNGISLNQGKPGYSFNLKCDFKEVTPNE